MTTAVDRCTPVVTQPRVEQSPVAKDDHWLAATSVPITGTEPVFEGHYPEFPIFPGVCIVDCAIASALAASPPRIGRLTLDAVESARFVGAVYPGVRLDISLDWRLKDGYWRCSAAATTGRGDAASIRLSFRESA
jgi:3-hydroxyacyl-[acyl-carrier-protein] dehydratase